MTGLLHMCDITHEFAAENLSATHERILLDSFSLNVLLICHSQTCV